MSNLETLDVGQANELKLAFRRTGWTNEELKRLCEGRILADFRSVLLGHTEVKPVEHVINCDADPFVPGGWKVEEHQKRGFFKWDPKRVQLYLSPVQREGVIACNELCKELEGKPTLNANVLDYLLAHPHLIPEEWKRDEMGRVRFIYFWGTIYRDPFGLLRVRFLYWRSDRWYWGCCWPGRGWWGADDPAALLAS